MTVHPSARSTLLRFLELEPREMPALTLDLLGYHFEATRDFNDLGSGVYSVTGPVSIGKEPDPGAAFKPVITVTDGFQIRSYESKDKTGQLVSDAELSLTASTIQIAGVNGVPLFTGSYVFDSMNRLKKDGYTGLTGGERVKLNANDNLDIVPSQFRFTGSQAYLGGLAQFKAESTPVLLPIPVTLGVNNTSPLFGAGYGVSVRFGDDAKFQIGGTVEWKDVAISKSMVATIGFRVETNTTDYTPSFSAYGHIKENADQPKWMVSLGTKDKPGFTIDTNGKGSFSLGFTGRFDFASLTLDVKDLLLSGSFQTGKWDDTEWGISGAVKLSTKSQSMTKDDTQTTSVLQGVSLKDLLGPVVSMNYDIQVPPADDSVAMTLPDPPPTPAAEGVGQGEKAIFKGIEAEFAATVKGFTSFDVLDANFYLSGGFQLGPLDVEVKRLGLAYVRTKDTTYWGFSGGLAVTWKEQYTGELTLPKDGLTITNGRVQFNGLSFKLSQKLEGGLSLPIRAIEIDYARLSDGQYRIALGGVLRMPAGWDLGARGEFRFGDFGFALDSVRVDYAKGTTLGIAMGSSGLFLTRGSLLVQNPFTSDTRLVGNVTIEDPGQVTISGTKGAFIEINGQITIDRRGLTIQGNAKMVNGKLGEGSARLDLNWAEGIYRLDGNLTFLEGFVQAHVQIELNTGEVFRARLSATVNVPKFSPILPGERLASADVALVIWLNNPDNSKTSYIAAWAVPYFRVGTFGLMYKWGKESGFDFVGYKTADAIANDFRVGPTSYSLTKTVQVQANQPTVGLDTEIKWVYEVPGARVEVKDRDGKVVATSVLSETTTSKRIRIGTTSGTTPLTPGTYTITVTSSRAFGPRLSSEDARFNTSFLPGDTPTIRPANLSVQPDGSLSVAFTTTGVRETQLTARLFARSRGSDQTGVEVGSTSVNAGEAGALVWRNFSSQPPKDFSFFVVLEDDLRVYAPLRSEITGTARPPVQAGGSVSRQSGGARSALLADWPLFLDLDDNGQFSEAEPVYYTDSNGKYVFNGLAPGTYTLRVAMPEGFQTAANQPLIDGKPGYLITIGQGQNLRLNWDFVLVQANTVEGIAFNDLNADGRQDPGEGPAVGVTTYLDLNRNGRPDLGEPRSVTGRDGVYSFIDLEPGSYAVRVIAPVAGRVTTAAGGDAVVAGLDQLVVGPQFGLVLPVTITGRAFVERGGWVGYSHGIDIPLPGSVLTLVDAQGRVVRNAAGQPVSTTADADGFYSFEPLPLGEYRVVQTPPAGYTPVSGAVEAAGFVTPQPLGDLGTANRGNTTQVVADVNADGIPDLVIASTTQVTTPVRQGSWPVVVLPGRGDGTFGPADSAVPYFSAGLGTSRLTPENIYGQWMTVTDLNRDNLPDVLLVTSYRAGSRNLMDVQVLFARQLPNTAGGGLATGQATFFTQTVPLGGTGPGAPAVGVADLNGDGWLDLVVAADSQPKVLINSFAKDVGRTSSTIDNWRTPFNLVPVVQPATPWGQVNGLTVGDFSGTGRTDVLLTTRTGNKQEVVRLWNDGQGRLAVDTAQLIDSAGPMATGDFDRDGLPDVVVLDQVNREVRVGLNTADERFRSADLTQPFGATSLPEMSYQSVLVADMNADGWVDIVVSGLKNGKPTAVVLINDAGGTFLEPVELVTATPPGGNGRVTVGDLNRDGLPDLVFSGSGTGWVSLNGRTGGTSQLLNLASGASAVVDSANRGNGSISGSVPADSKYAYINSYGLRIPESVKVADLIAYLDENRNGRYDFGERTTTFTPSPSGDRYEFRFDGLESGTHVVGLWLRGWYDYFANTLQIPTATPFTQTPLAVTLSEGQAVTNLDFVRPGGRVSGAVFVDLNQNRRRDAGEPGLAGAQVFDDVNRNGILDVGEAVLGVTNADGGYELTAPATSFWRVAVAPPVGFTTPGYSEVNSPYLINGRKASSSSRLPRSVYLDGGVSVEEVWLPVIPVLSPGSVTSAGEPLTSAGAVSLATADWTGDGRADLVVGAGAGEAPRVRVLDAVTGEAVWDFFAFEEPFRGGVSVAVGDVTGDGVADLVVGAGAGGGPRVRVFDGATRGVVTDFFAFEPSFRGGVSVAVGDFTGDGVADLAVGAGAGGGPRVKVYDGATGEVVTDFFAFDEGHTDGVRLGFGDLNSDGQPEVLLGVLIGGDFRIRSFTGQNLAEEYELELPTAP